MQRKTQGQPEPGYEPMNRRQQESLSPNLVWDTTDQNYMSTHATPSLLNVMAPAYTPLLSDVALLAQAIQDSIVVNRLPAPEPSVFDGNPLHFVEWKALFMSLIDQHKTSAAYMLYYLRKYVGGAACKTLDGVFHRNDDEAYQDAWKKLNQRYGQSFVIQRAFRDKLASWPKFKSKDVEELRNFADFWSGSHPSRVRPANIKWLWRKSKTQLKLPDWLASHWNRQVTQTLNDKTEYPSFQDFTDFMSTEADIACNPITSYHALHSSNILTEKRNQRDMKGTKPVFLTLKQWHRVKVQNWLNKVQDLNVFFVRAITISSITALSSGQSLWRNDDDMSKKTDCATDAWQLVIMQKTAHHRHSCEICKRKHPTCLHDESYSGIYPLPQHSWKGCKENLWWTLWNAPSF